MQIALDVQSLVVGAVVIMSLASVIPTWKLHREWRRLKQQVSQIEWLMFGAQRRARYDRDRRHLVSVTQGDQPLQPDAAVILIFQPDGVLPSLIAELNHFLANNISPVVVSNLPLTAADRSLLQRHCHLVIERPNFGYDFGGYREGILTLAERGAKLRNLFVKNDSIWFPVSPQCQLLNRSLKSKADIYGIYLNETPKQAHRAHLQSYFYRFGPRLVNSPAFLDHWKNICLTDNKYMVVRQCEMKLTQAFRTQGFTVDSMYRMADLQYALKLLSDSELKEVMRYHAQVDTRSAAVLGPLVRRNADPGWRAAVEALIDKDRVGKYFLIAHPLPLIDKLHCPVLKKDRQPMYRLQRKTLLASGYDKIMGDELRKEFSSWDLADAK